MKGNSIDNLRDFFTFGSNQLTYQLRSNNHVLRLPKPTRMPECAVLLIKVLQLGIILRNIESFNSMVYTSNF